MLSPAKFDFVPLYSPILMSAPRLNGGAHVLGDFGGCSSWRSFGKSVGRWICAPGMLSSMRRKEQRPVCLSLSPPSRIKVKRWRVRWRPRWTSFPAQNRQNPRCHWSASYCNLDFNSFFALDSVFFFILDVIENSRLRIYFLIENHITDDFIKPTGTRLYTFLVWIYNL